MIAPYPLAWPAGWPRTPAGQRKRPQFGAALAFARDSLLDELRLLGVRQGDAVITSDLPTRLDGLPYSNGRVADPGIAVYWRRRKLGSDGRWGHIERVMACDRWDSPGGNMRALALSIGALRGLDRWGSSSLIDRAFEGFAALPGVPEIDWRAEIGVPQGATLLGVRDAYRRLAAERHPDHGGDPEAMSRLNRAWEAAQRELGS